MEGSRIQGRDVSLSTAIEIVQTEGYVSELRHAIDSAVPNAGHDAGGQNIVELHGSRYKVSCLECHLRIARENFNIKVIPPRCPSCNGLIKGDSVMFGEPIPRPEVQRCLDYVSKCECIVLVGTSGTVYPVASFPRMMQSNGGVLVEINPQETEHSASCDVVLRGSGDELITDDCKSLSRTNDIIGIDFSGWLLCPNCTLSVAIQVRQAYCMVGE